MGGEGGRRERRKKKEQSAEDRSSSAKASRAAHAARPRLVLVPHKIYYVSLIIALFFASGRAE